MRSPHRKDARPEDVPLTAEDSLRVHCATCGAAKGLPCLGRAREFPHETRLWGAQLAFFRKRRKP